MKYLLLRLKNSNWKHQKLLQCVVKNYIFILYTVKNSCLYIESTQHNLDCLKIHLSCLNIKKGDNVTFAIIMIY